MEWRTNLPNLSGTSLQFLERRQDDGSLKRYAIAATQAEGFEIVDITDPESPTVVGRYVSPGVPYHASVQVNPRRNIVSLTIEDPGFSPNHLGSTGIEFVDITDLSNPVRLGSVQGLEGPHVHTMIDDRYIYTALPTYIIDYSDPKNPVNLGANGRICGHSFNVDPNDPTRVFVGSCGSFRWQILDVSDPKAPKVVQDVTDNRILYAHEVMPSPDGAIVAVSDFRAGHANLSCPGGGLHFYDISGKYVDGASLMSPMKLGMWFPPFTGAGNDPNQARPWASCTAHAFVFHPERYVVSGAWYAGGSWVADVTSATASSGLYAEYKAQPGLGLGPTTWGNTVGNFLAEGDYAYYTKWAPFDDPSYERYLFVNGPVRGLDVYRYTGPLPKKVARLTVEPSARDGAVVGSLQRFPRLTYDGLRYAALGGKTLTVNAAGQSVTTMTADDGSFRAPLDLTGAHEVTIQWAGDDDYQEITLTRSVSF